MTPEMCEWDPKNSRPAATYPNGQGRQRRTGCPNVATLLVGRTDDWHLCPSCADLPRFARMRYRKALRGGGN